MRVSNPISVQLQTQAFLPVNLVSDAIDFTTLNPSSLEVLLNVISSNIVTVSGSVVSQRLSCKLMISPHWTADAPLGVHHVQAIVFDAANSDAKHVAYSLWQLFACSYAYHIYLVAYDATLHQYSDGMRELLFFPPQLLREQMDGAVAAHATLQQVRGEHEAMRMASLDMQRQLDDARVQLQQSQQTIMQQALQIAALQAPQSELVSGEQQHIVSLQHQNSELLAKIHDLQRQMCDLQQPLDRKPRKRSAVTVPVLPKEKGLRSNEQKQLYAEDFRLFAAASAAASVTVDSAHSASSSLSPSVVTVPPSPVSASPELETPSFKRSRAIRAVDMSAEIEKMQAYAPGQHPMELSLAQASACIVYAIEDGRVSLQAIEYYRQAIIYLDQANQHDHRDIKPECTEHALQLLCFTHYHIFQLQQSIGVDTAEALDSLRESLRNCCIGNHDENTIARYIYGTTPRLQYEVFSSLQSKTQRWCLRQVKESGYLPAVIQQYQPETDAFNALFAAADVESIFKIIEYQFALTVTEGLRRTAIQSALTAACDRFKQAHAVSYAKIQQVLDQLPVSSALTCK